MNINIQFVAKSSNSKIGAIPCTTSERSTCPSTCPFINDGGCYAESGFYTKLNWNEVDNGNRALTWNAAMYEIDSLPDGVLWRHNVAGDLPHKNGIIIKSMVRDLIRANYGVNRHKKGFTYTHHDMMVTANRDIVEEANNERFITNLSANSLHHADELLSLGIAPVVSTVLEDYQGIKTTPQGNRVIVCPAITHKNVTCKTCGLCQKVDRDYVIAFPAHGSAKKKVEQVINLNSIR